MTTFALPDLQGRLPIHIGSGFVQGQRSGEENHTLLISEIPSHTHTVGAKTQAATNAAAGGVYGGGGLAAYKAASGGTMNAAVVQLNPGNQPHDNLMPFGVLNFIISLYGIFPSRS